MKHLFKGQCVIASLSKGSNVTAEATIIEQIGDNDYIALYKGKKCRATKFINSDVFFVADKLRTPKNLSSYNREAR